MSGSGFSTLNMVAHVILMLTVQSRCCHDLHLMNVDTEARINSLPKVTEFQLGCKPRQSHSRVNWAAFHSRFI